MALHVTVTLTRITPELQKTRSDTPRIAYPRNAAGCFPAVALSGDPTPKGIIMLKFLVIAQNKFAELRDNESGNAAEYGLIIGLVSVVIIGGLVFLGTQLLGTFNNVANQLP